VRGAATGLVDRARHRARVVGSVPAPEGPAPRRSPLHVADEDDAATTSITATLYAISDAPTTRLTRVPAPASRRPSLATDLAAYLARFNRPPWIVALFLALMVGGVALGLFVVLPLLLELANALSFLLPAVFTLPAAILLPSAAWFTYRIVTKRNTNA
jgi:hypothetical protein